MITGRDDIRTRFSGVKVSLLLRPLFAILSLTTKTLCISFASRTISLFVPADVPIPLWWCAEGWLSVFFKIPNQNYSYKRRRICLYFVDSGFEDNTSPSNVQRIRAQNENVSDDNINGGEIKKWIALLVQLYWGLHQLRRVRLRAFYLLVERFWLKISKTVVKWGNHISS